VAEILDAVGALSTDAADPLRGPVGVRDGLSETVRLVLDAVPVRTGAGEASIARAAGVSSLVVQQVLPPLFANGLVERTQDGWRLTALGASRPAPPQPRRAAENG
jgi:DNA processing protein